MCVHILSAHPIQSISGWRSGIVIVSSSQLPDWRATPCHCGAGSWHPLKTWTLPQCQEVHIWTTHGTVSWPYYFGRLCGDGSHQGGWCWRLANPEECDWGPVLHGACQLLPVFHLGLLAVKISQVIYLFNLNIYSNFNLFLFLSWNSLSKHSSYTVISGVLFPWLFS